MDDFARLVNEEASIWLEQEEDELETARRGSMGTIVDKVMETWSALTLPSQPNPRYLIERNLIPGRLLRGTGGYDKGPRSWP